MANLIPSGTAEVASADIVLTAAQTISLNIFRAGGEGLAGAVASVQVKASNNEFFEIGVLDAEEPFKLLSGPGTFRVVRRVAAVAFGVDQS
jgi:hypothetical protein